MSIFVCFVFVLFVDICHQWACEFKDVKLFVGLVQDGDVGLQVCDQDLGRDGAPPQPPRDQVNHCALRTFVCLNLSPHRISWKIMVNYDENLVSQ